MARPAWLAPTLRGYRREWFADDLLAGLVLAVLLLPQSLAYAMLAGLPPHFGLYASIFPVLAYALLGSSTLMAVGPVAVVALMNMTTLAPLATPGSEHYIALSAQLAWLSGAILLVLGWLRLGFLARLLSHAVMGGFVTGAALLIVIGQLPGLLGVPATGATALDQLTALMSGLGDAHRATAALGFTSLLLLVVGQRVLPRCLLRFGLSMRSVQLSSRLWPLVVVALATTIVALAELGTKHGVPVVGVIPSGIALPAPVWPTDATSSGLWRGALAIALVSFVESVSVAQALALRRRERVRPDAELLGLGLAKLVGGFSGALSVSGSFSRSAINATVGARTQLANIIAAAVLGLVALVATGLFQTLPLATLAATIIVSVLGLIDIAGVVRMARFDRGDATAWLLTALGTLAFGVEVGILSGLVTSLAVLLWHASHPHIAVVAPLPGTGHVKNVARHAISRPRGVLALRIDENLFFGNITALMERVELELEQAPDAHHVVLVLSAVNGVDYSALEGLEALDRDLAAQGIVLHLAEIKGPVLDRLRQSRWLDTLAGRIHPFAADALSALVDRSQTRSADDTIDTRQAR